MISGDSPSTSQSSMLQRSTGTWAVDPSHRANASPDNIDTAAGLKRSASEGDLSSGLGMHDKRMRNFIHNSLTSAPESHESAHVPPPIDVVIKLDDAKESSRAKPDAFSTHDSTIIEYQGSDHYLKCNSHNHRAAFMEVVTAMIDRDWLKDDDLVPEVKFASNLKKFISSKAASVGIASKMIEGYCDWGTFLVDKRDKETGEILKPAPALKFLNKDSTEKAYRALLKRHTEIEEELAEKVRTTHLTMHGKTYPVDQKTNGDNKHITVEIARQLAPINKLELARVRLEDEMLGMLRPEFLRGSRGAVKLHFQSEANGNWDVNNHRRDNSGVVIVDGELVGFASVDYGVSGLNGFEGKTKEDSADAIRVVARWNDPFLQFSDEILDPKHPNARDPNEVIHLSEGYMPGQVINKDIVDFGKVSQTPGLLGSSPRVAIVGTVMGDVVREYMNSGKKPDEMLEVAFNVDKISREDLIMTIKRACDECESNGHPVIKAMLAENRRIMTGNGACSGQELAEAIADEFHAHFRAIAERSGDQDMKAWAHSHKNEAQRISQRVDNARRRLAAAQD